MCIKELGKIYGNREEYDKEELKVVLIEDAVEPMFKREKRLLKTWKKNLAQEDLRHVMVGYICGVCVKFRLSRSTAALGVHIFNYFQGSHTIGVPQIHLVALTCLFIAAKVHQPDASLVSMRRLSRTIPLQMTYSVKLFLSIELMILAFFDHDMLIPTVNDFIETYCVIAVEDSDVLCKEFFRELNGIWPEDGTTLQAFSRDSKLLAATVRRDLRFLSSQMTNVMALLLDKEPSNQFAPSLIAAAILCVTRLAYQFTRWCGHFERITRYPHEKVVTCINDYVLVNSDVRTFLNISRSCVIKCDMLESDEFITKCVFQANVYPDFIMIGGKVVQKSALKHKPNKISPTSSNTSSGCGHSSGIDTSTSSSLSDSPMSISSS